MPPVDTGASKWLQDVEMSCLNLSWILDGQLAGHAAPTSGQDLVWLKGQGILSLVRMAEAHAAMVSGAQIARLGLFDCHEPVPDYRAPTQEQIDRMINFITSSLAAGRPVGVSCTAGLGRTGTILACYLVTTGQDAGAAMNEVRARRPRSIETKEQERAVKEYAARMRTG